MPLTFPCVYSVLGRREWPAVPLHATSAAYSRTRRSRSPRLRIFETFLAACSVRRARRYGRPLIGTGRIRTSEDQTFLSHRVGLVSLEGRPNVVDEDPTSRARLSLLHQGPFFVDHLLGVRTGEFLDVMALGFGESMGEPEDLGQSVGLLLGRILGRIEFLPHGDDHERQQHGVDDAQDGVDEASHVVVLLAHLRGHKSLHQREPAARGEADRANHQDAVNYAAHRRGIPFSRGLAGGPHHTSWEVNEQIGFQRNSKDRTYRASRRLSRQKPGIYDLPRTPLLRASVNKASAGVPNWCRR